MAIFRDDRDRADFIRRLGDGILATELSCYAWALLTNHAHFLLRTGDHPLASLMRSLLTGYALYFNRRHRRVGYLFQNRYKSIICEERRYFLELVRYIHLNPLRAGLTPDVDSLDDYLWCGHSVIMGRRPAPWQDTEIVLAMFGSSDGQARQAYLDFIREGISQGHREDLSGGGLIRSAGGWQRLRELRKAGGRQRGDERILGNARFAEQILERIGEKLTVKEQSLSAKRTLARLLEGVASDCGVDPVSIMAKNKNQACSAARAIFAIRATQTLGYSITEVAAFLAVDRAAVFRAVQKGKIAADRKEAPILSSQQVTSVP
ncbi:MAG: hypothetical protein NTV79_08245 [Candidatus Aureabacteria bacterium]|nr:hypothetical protein [Candidatus Auribacterota bacterium]